MAYTGKIEYAHERKIRERNTTVYRICHLPIWIWVFFLAPGPLTLSLFAHGFNRWNGLWLAVVMLGKVKRKLDETGNTIEEAAHRSRQLEKKLKKVEALPAAEAANLIDDGGVMDDENLTGTDFVNSTAARL